MGLNAKGNYMKNEEFKKGEIVIYKAKGGPLIDVRLKEETMWLTQKQMSILFKKDVDTIVCIWATNVLRKHLVDCYTINEKRLKTQQNKINELQEAVRLLGNIALLENVSDEA